MVNEFKFKRGDFIYKNILVLEQLGIWMEHSRRGTIQTYIVLIGMTKNVLDYNVGNGIERILSIEKTNPPEGKTIFYWDPKYKNHVI